MTRDVFIPRNLEALWDLLDEDPESRVFAGGTDLFVRLRRDQAVHPSLIGLERIEELQALEEDGPDVFIGACVTHARISASPLVKKHFSVLEQAVRVLGSPPIRNMGTLGGNLVTASPAGDTIPPLTVLGAEVEVRSRGASRRLPIREFIRGPGRSVLEQKEILSGIRLRKDNVHTVHHFEKVGQRNALAIAVVSLAAVLRLSESGVVERARLAWGSVGPTVITSREVERIIEGRPLSRQVLEEAAMQAQKEVSPIDDLRASADYRRRVAGNLLLRLWTRLKTLDES